MKRSEALSNARGQIVWILALVLSTATIIYLERLDISAPAKQSAQVTSALRSSAAEALITADARYKAHSDDPQAAAGLVLALSVAVQAGAIDSAEGRARLEAPRSHAAANTEDWRAVAVLADLTFGR